MEETIKYFQPDITDLKVGYECEVKWHTFGDGINWKSYIVKAGDSILTTNNVRVPFLTKEQIEAEGWRESEKGKGITTVPENFPFLIFLKDNYILSFVKEKQRLEIQKKMGDSQWYIFQGFCKDINTLRYICKLLGI